MNISNNLLLCQKNEVKKSLPFYLIAMGGCKAQEACF